MEWTKISPFGQRQCASAHCHNSARWRGESGGVSSEYCSTCRDAIDDQELMAAVRGVLAFDWSDNDADACRAIERLRKAAKN